MRGSETFEMDVTLNIAASHVVSAHIGHLCHDAADLTFARSSDLHLLAQSKYRQPESLAILRAFITKNYELFMSSVVD